MPSTWEGNSIGTMVSMTRGSQYQAQCRRCASKFLTGIPAQDTVMVNWFRCPRCEHYSALRGDDMEIVNPGGRHEAQEASRWSSRLGPRWVRRLLRGRRREERS